MKRVAMKRFAMKRFSKKSIIRSLDAQIYATLKPLRVPLLLTHIVFTIGTLGYVFIDKFSFIDAIYQTGITFTTVGFGEVSPISHEGRIFTILLIISGFATFSIAIATIGEIVRKGVFFKLLKERKMLQQIIQLSYHYVIYYHNEYSSQVAYQLKKKHIPFVIVDPNEEFDEIAKANQYPFYIIEQPHTEEAHLKSNLAAAKGAIILSQNMADNIAQVVSIRLYEKELAKSPYYITSFANKEADIDKLIKLGADQVLSPMKLLAEKIGIIATDPKKSSLSSFLEELFYKKDSEMKIEEFTVTKESWLALKKIKDTYIRALMNVSVIGITNQKGQFIPMPRGDITIGVGVRILLMGKGKDMQKTLKMVASTTPPKAISQYNRLS